MSELLTPATTPEKQGYWRIDTPSPPHGKSSRIHESVHGRRSRTCIVSCPAIVGLIVGSFLFGVFTCSSVNQSFGYSLVGVDSTMKNTRGSTDSQENTQASLEKQSPLDQEGDSPKLAWLMTFPNSGTSYTAKLVRHLTGMSTATNYGDEYVDKTRASVPLFANSTNGPYLIATEKYDRPKGNMYILTKTHCGGRCGTCAPRDYIESPSSFLNKCLSGGGQFAGESGGKSVKKEGTYSLDLVKRTIHLIRNPFDNIVSRFHLGLKRNHTGQFPSTKEGFRDFCAVYDGRWTDNEPETIWWDDELHNILKDVPCHADFYRYANWHNLVFAISRDIGLPEYILHYENFETRYEETKNEILEFLNVKESNEAFPFIAGKSYETYFTDKERRAVKDAMKIMAFKTTWRNIQHYFDDV